MGFDPLANITGSQRTIRIALLAIILLTLPCYCLGAILLATAPESEAARSTGTQPPTLGGRTASPTVTPFMFASPTPRSDELRPTATQLFLYPTVPQFTFPTATITPLPQPTIPPPPTVAPTITVPPSPTLPPTDIPIPTDPPTDVPPPTDPPPPTDAPPPTDSPPDDPGVEELTPTPETF